jgi:hypothetical protein
MSERNQRRDVARRTKLLFGSDHTPSGDPLSKAGLYETDPNGSDTSHAIARAPARTGVPRGGSFT